MASPLSLALPSPASVAAPAPRSVAGRAAWWGAAFVGVRPSARSCSGWVLAAAFRCRQAARRFALCAAVAFSFPFCSVRPAGCWWLVSVPVFVATVPPVSPGSLPVFWWPVSGGGGGGGDRPSPVPPVPPAPVPPSVLAAVEAAPAVGFCGGRSVSPPPAVVSALVEAVPPAVAPAVGCATGADAAFRVALGDRAAVFAVPRRPQRWSFAARSVALVRSLAPAGLLVAFPSGPAPAGLVPCRGAFSGHGSGTWASVALAVWLGLRVCVCLPPGVVPPGRWGFSSIGPGWFVVGF